MTEIDLQDPGLQGALSGLPARYRCGVRGVERRQLRPPKYLVFFKAPSEASMPSRSAFTRSTPTGTG